MSSINNKKNLFMIQHKMNFRTIPKGSPEGEILLFNSQKINFI